MTQTQSSVIILPRLLPARVIEAAVHLAVELENEQRPSLPLCFVRRVEPGGREFMLGQNSCLSTAKLHVRPVDGALFGVGKRYLTIEALWCSVWPKIECDHAKHTSLTRAQAIASFTARLQLVLRAATIT